MSKAFFITGTDTGVGKTWASIALMRYFQKQAKSAIGMKPVAAGCEWLDGQLKNEDALLMQQHASVKLDYQEINPYAFEAPVSPHLAAVNNPVQIEGVLKVFNKIKNKADVTIVEGAGGWFAPLNNEQDIADLAIALKLPVIMVVAIRLGCINHARLTFQAIQAANVECAGWIAMCVDSDMNKQVENITTIKNKITSPLLGVLPYMNVMDFDSLAENIIREKLI